MISENYLVYSHLSGYLRSDTFRVEINIVPREAGIVTSMYTVRRRRRFR